jgi:nicotinamide-nucleotide amidase
MTESNPDPSPAARLHDLLSDGRQVTLVTAESCTGGNIAHRITRNAGSSVYFLGSVVAYANDVKRHVLGVPQAILENPGAVSEPCARAMAEGVRRLMRADFAVATTGIAGPAGGTVRKPVGLVYIALATPERTVVEEHHFTGDRDAVIEAATDRALALLVTLLELPGDPLASNRFG